MDYKIKPALVGKLEKIKFMLVSGDDIDHGACVASLKTATRTRCTSEGELVETQEVVGVTIEQNYTLLSNDELEQAIISVVVYIEPDISRATQIFSDLHDKYSKLNLSSVLYFLINVNPIGTADDFLSHLKAVTKKLESELDKFEEERITFERRLQLNASVEALCKELEILGAKTW